MSSLPGKRRRARSWAWQESTGASRSFNPIADTGSLGGTFLGPRDTPNHDAGHNNIVLATHFPAGRGLHGQLGHGDTRATPTESDYNDIVMTMSLLLS